MKRLFTVLAVGLLTAGAAFAQQTPKFPGIDASPADIARYEADGETIAKVVYSRPQMKGREVFGELVPYGKVWRTGANEATEITFYKDVMFGGKAVKAGTYTLFTIPGEDSWKVMLNSELNQWGAYRRKQENDILEVEAGVKMLDDAVEAFTITFTKDGNMVFAWDKTMASLPIK